MSKSFSDLLDEAIAAENRRVIATLCRKCGGTGTVYIPIGPPEARYSEHRRERCATCRGTGDR
jgi:hypothetical protein